MMSKSNEAAQKTKEHLRVAAIQMEICSGEPKKNMVRAEALINDAARKGAQAVLLPELWTTGYSLSRFEELANRFAGETLEFLQGEARKLNMMIVGGSFPQMGTDG